MLQRVEIRAEARYRTDYGEVGERSDGSPAPRKTRPLAVKRPGDQQTQTGKDHLEPGHGEEILVASSPREARSKRPPHAGDLRSDDSRHEPGPVVEPQLGPDE